MYKHGVKGSRGPGLKGSDKQIECSLHQQPPVDQFLCNAESCVAYWHMNSGMASGGLVGTLVRRSQPSPRHQSGIVKSNLAVVQTITGNKCMA